jgi:hypothetical protein
MSGNTESVATTEPGTGPAPPTMLARFRPPRRVVVAGFVVGVALVFAIGGLVWWLLHQSAGDASRVEPPVEWQRTSVSPAGLIERSGVRLVRVAVTGGGGLLDVRFQVVDPNKAVAVHEPVTPPAIVDERTGLVFNILFMNHAHTGELKPAVTYYLVFENTGNWIRRGSKVTVLLGDAQVENVVVR